MLGTIGTNLLVLASMQVPIPEHSSDFALKLNFEEKTFSGILSASSKRSSATVVIVPGSGDLDIDGNGSGFIKPNTYKLLSDILNKTHNLNVFRYEKYSQEDTKKAGQYRPYIPLSDHASRLGQWIDAIKKRTSSRCLWLVGHSEGGVVSLILSQSREDICGIILAATPGNSLDKILETQIKRSLVNDREKEVVEIFFQDVRNARKPKSTGASPVLKFVLNDYLRHQILDYKRYDVSGLISKSKRPVYYVYGSADQNASKEQFEIACKNPAVLKCRELEFSNHFFKRVYSTSMLELSRSYSVSHPVDMDFVDYIVKIVSNKSAF